MPEVLYDSLNVQNFGPWYFPLSSVPFDQEEMEGPEEEEKEDEETMCITFSISRTPQSSSSPCRQELMDGNLNKKEHSLIRHLVLAPIYTVRQVFLFIILQPTS